MLFYINSNIIKIALIHFRSPLLMEFRLIFILLATKMFQFAKLYNFILKKFSLRRFKIHKNNSF